MSKIDNLSCDKFLQLNYNKKDKLDLLVSLISPFFSLIKSEKKDALHFFSQEYYYYYKDLSTGNTKFNSLAVYSCHVTYAFQSESTLYSCLNVKELLARSRHEI